MDRTTYLRTAAIWAVGGLLGNYAWEMAQMPLYAGFAGGFHWWRCFVAALGDVAVLALLYLLMAAATRSWLWASEPTPPRIALLVVLGAGVAIVIELYALALGRWSYAPAMPRVPLLGVGVVPLLQMTIIPSILVWLSRSARTA